MRLRLSLPQRWPVYTIGVLIVLLSLVTLVGERGALHLWRLRGEKARLDEQNYRLQKENESLRRRVHDIRNNDDYLEKLAREELNMARPGEIVYRFQSQGTRDASRQEANEPVSPPRPATAQKEPR
jgi:cell division protein FtsB